MGWILNLNSEQQRGWIAADVFNNHGVCSSFEIVVKGEKYALKITNHSGPRPFVLRIHHRISPLLPLSDLFFS